MAAEDGEQGDERQPVRRAAFDAGPPGFEDGARMSRGPAESPSDPGPEPTGGDEGSEDQEDTNLDRSRAGRRGGGGGPTRSEQGEDDRSEGDEFKSNLLLHALGLEDSRVSAFGWVQGGLTGNPSHPRSGQNFGVSPNFRANKFALQQLYFVLERAIDPDKPGDYDYGFRVDNLFGTDWQQFHMVGLFDNAFNPNRFGYEPTQFYGEVHLPWLTPGGVDVKGGRFFSLGGYEDTLAPSRPLNSAGYLFGFAHPFTHFGVMSNWHVTDRLNLYNGVVNGWDRWIDQNYRWGYAGAASYDSADGKTNVSVSLNAGPNQFPSFFKAGYQFAPNGVPLPPFLAGRKNVLYGKNHAALVTGVLIHEFTDRLSFVTEADYGHETNIPGLGPGGTPADGTWYGGGAWLLYKLGDRTTGVFRLDALRDRNGSRTGYDDTFYETTLGLILKPKPWLWFRPEVRYDWADGKPPYNDGQSRRQLTFGFDVIFLF